MGTEVDEDIQRCISGLETAKKCEDVGDRETLALMVISDIHDLEGGEQLAEQVEFLIAADQIDDAIELLQTKPKKGRLPWFFLLFLLGPLIGGGYLFFSPIIDGHRQVAIDAMNQCHFTGELLGTAEATLGCNLGTTENGKADWAVSVTGQHGSGRLSYLAEKTNGRWDVLNAAVKVDEAHYLVVPCKGEVSASDAEGILRRGFDGVGTAKKVTGQAPVSAGDSCRVRVHVDPDYPNVTYNCRVEVDCGGQMLYGATPTTGYVFCNVLSGSPILARDEEGTGESVDPMLHLDLNAREVWVRDDDKGSTYEILIAL
ncbi:MAG: hypothetical protein HN348_19590 [Proteobacteria bacterium]|jgi:hypothetical protein|nr:hypothetical protein [Pseudomonadota bacterium]